MDKKQLKEETLRYGLAMYAGNDTVFESIVGLFLANRGKVANFIGWMEERGYIQGNQAVEGMILKFLPYGPNDPQLVEKVKVAVAMERRRGYADLMDRIHLVMGEFGGKNMLTIEVRGPTGGGKSACIMHILEKLSVKPAGVSDHMAYSSREMLRKMKNLHQKIHERGETWPKALAMDEQEAAVGEGSTTKLELINQQERQLRIGGVTLLYANANGIGPRTRNITLETLGISEKNQSVLVIVYEGEEPVSVAEIPWCSTPLHEAAQKEKWAHTNRVAKGVSEEAADLQAMLVDLLLNKLLMDTLRRTEFGKSSVAFEITPYLGGYATSQIHRLTDLVVELGRKASESDDEMKLLLEIEHRVDRGLLWLDRTQELKEMRERVTGGAP